MGDRVRPIRFQSLSTRLHARGYAYCGGFLLAAFTSAAAQLPPTVEQRQLANPGITCLLQDALGHPVSGLGIEVRSATPPLELATAVTESDGKFRFDGLPAGPYDVTVAGAILLPPKRVPIDRPGTVLVLQLPITVLQASGQHNHTVSVRELAVPETAQKTLRQAYDAWEANDTARSRDLVARALQIHPDYGAALALLGVVELKEGNPAAAIIDLRKAIRLSPNAPRPYLALASAYNLSRDNAQALHALSIVAKLVSDNWQMHYEAGRAYLGLGRFETALGEFNQAQLLAQPDSVVVHVAKAHALLGLQNVAAARAELETVLRASPDGPYAAQSRQLATTLDSQLTPSPPKSDAISQSFKH